MPNFYKRKTSQQSWDEKAMAEALTACQGGLSIHSSAKQYNIPSTTLFRRLKRPPEERLVKQLGRFRCVFTVDQERMLVDYILKMEERLFGLTISDLRYLTYEFAIRNNIEHRFNNEKKEAGKVWLLGFMKRHPVLSLRLPEKTSAARASAFNAVSVGKFFDLLEDLYQKHNYKPNRIYNCDETGISTVPNKPSKIISKKGKKQVGVLSSAERGTLTTAEICFNAAGEYIPPALIFPRVRHHLTFDIGVPLNTKIFTHASGWMQTEIFTAWFHHFIKFAKPTSEDRVLLILDGHSTHIKNIEVLELAKKNFVDILVLPPHCTHRLQPLDVSFMYPMSTFYEQAVRVWLRTHPGKVVTIHDVGPLFGEAYLKAASMATAISGFKKTGIWPFERPDPNVFVAADTTDRPGPLLATSNLPSASTPVSNDILLHKTIVSPADILPIPRVASNIENPTKKRARSGKTVVATSTPFIEELKNLKAPTPKNPTKKVTKQLFQSDSEEEDDANISIYSDTDSGSELDLPVQIPTIKTEDIKEGIYVAVEYNGQTFPGLVISKSGESASVKCMERTQKYFKWPNKDDVLDYNIKDIKMIINEPKQLRRGFFNVPELCLYA
ncbi:uncharacterized protein LOC126878985 [Diabrotica virgifera virgifera]|uniref:HTH CENPB-type domain-containing protein n=1 Tax=Diabrotica virgifera virgifera TaxID=50390 RepID=A0ABM5JIP4_DIAVI|nr:uncharacterized protein LOC126878985 [Diabrotica virgifera virgifera]